jgi:hypothetical protein
MDAVEWEALVRGVLPGPAWAFRGSLCYSLPVGRVLFGVRMEATSDPEIIRIARVSSPLFVPTGRIDRGMLVTGATGEDLSLVSDDVRAIVRSVVTIGYDEREELETLISEGLDTRSLERAEIAGYALLLTGDTPSALRILQRVGERAADDAGPAELALWKRVGTICDLLRAGGFAAARERLERWTDASVHELGLVRVHGVAGRAGLPTVGSRRGLGSVWPSRGTR